MRSHYETAQETHLTGIMRVIEEIVGTAALWKLIRRFGGRNLWFPSVMTRGHRIAKCVGFETACILNATIRCESIYIPQGDIVMKKRRDREIRKRYASGETADSLAAEYKLSARHVWGITGPRAQLNARQAGISAPARQA